MNRVDVCPSCGKTLRYVREFGYGKWVCPRCKYKRYEKTEENPLKFLKKIK